MVVAQRLWLGGWDEFIVVGQRWGQGIIDDAGWWGDTGVGWSSASGWWKGEDSPCVVFAVGVFTAMRHRRRGAVLVPWWQSPSLVVGGRHRCCRGGKCNEAVGTSQKVGWCDYISKCLCHVSKPRHQLATSAIFIVIPARIAAIDDDQPLSPQPRQMTMITNPPVPLTAAPITVNL